MPDTSFLVAQRQQRQHPGLSHGTVGTDGVTAVFLEGGFQGRL